VIKGQKADASRSSLTAVVGTRRHSGTTRGETGDSRAVGLVRRGKTSSVFVRQRSKNGGKRRQPSKGESPGERTFRVVNALPRSPCQGEGRGIESRRPLQLDLVRSPVSTRNDRVHGEWRALNRQSGTVQPRTWGAARERCGGSLCPLPPPRSRAASQTLPRVCRRLTRQTCQREEMLEVSEQRRTAHQIEQRRRVPSSRTFRIRGVR
jgi:hypothetical protein